MTKHYRDIDIKHINFRTGLLYFYGFHSGDPFTFADKIIDQLDKFYIKKEEIGKNIDKIEQRLNDLKNPKEIDPLKDYSCYDACIRTLGYVKELLK